MASFEQEYLQAPDVVELCRPNNPEAFIAVAGESHYSAQLLALYGQLEIEVSVAHRDFGRPKTREEAIKRHNDKANFDSLGSIVPGRNFVHSETEDPEKVLENARYMMLHSFILAGEAIHVRNILPTINDPNLKTALFYTAVATAQSSEKDDHAYNLASLEVLTAYDMGDALELELQKANDTENLQKVLCTKIAGGFDMHANTEKLKLQLEHTKVQNAHLFDYFTSAQAKLLRTGNYADFIALGNLLNPGFYDSDTAEFLAVHMMEYLTDVDPDSMSKKEYEAIQKKISESIAKKNANNLNPRKVRRALGRTTLHRNTPDGRAAGNIDALDGMFDDLKRLTIKYNDALIGPGKRGFLTKDNDPVQYIGDNSRLIGSTKAATVRLYDSLDGRDKSLSKSETIEALYEAMIDDHVNSKLIGISAIKSINQMLRLAGELVARRHEPTASSEITAAVHSQLEILESQRSETIDHHHMIDYYARERDKATEKRIVENCVNRINKAGSKTDKLFASKKLAEFIVGSFHDHGDLGDRAKEKYTEARDSVMHPFLLSILGHENLPKLEEEVETS